MAFGQHRDQAVIRPQPAVEHAGGSSRRIIEPAPEVPPPWPGKTRVAADGIANYATLGYGDNCASGYAATGIMSVLTWNNRCYGDVPTGTVFLLPGIVSDDPPNYDGRLFLSCLACSPMVGNARSLALQAQLCALLRQPTQNFIGFAVKYPFNELNVSYDGGPCNKYWFGTQTLPADWQLLVFNTLQTALAPESVERPLFRDPATPA